MAKKTTKAFWASVHAWLGALSAIFILSVSITGMAIAFSAPLLDWETNAFPSVEKRAGTNPADIDSLVFRAKEKVGDTFLPLGYLGADAEIATNVEMIYGLSDVPENGGEVQIVSFNPSDDNIIDIFYLDRTLTHLLIDFHYELLGGTPGKIFVCIIALLMIALAIVGLYLWWPIKGSVWKKAKALRLNGNAFQKSFSLHRFFGFWSSMVVLIWGLTGVYWSQPNWSPSFVQPSTDNISSHILEKFKTQCEQRISITDATEIALSYLSGTELNKGRVLEVELSAPWQPYHTIYLSTGDDIDKKDGDVRVWVSSTCENLVHVERVKGLATIGAISASIHSGETFGVFRIPVIILVGSILTLLSITGLIVWITKLSFTKNPRVH